MIYHSHFFFTAKPHRYCKNPDRKKKIRVEYTQDHLEELEITETLTSISLDTRLYLHTVIGCYLSLLHGST